MAKKSENFIVRLLRRWFIDALGSMALGLFASLLIGTIFRQVGVWTGWQLLRTIADFATHPLVVGAAIGVAIAAGLQVKPLAVFSAAVTGAIGYASFRADGSIGTGGGPVGAYLAAIAGAEIGNLVAGKTKLDILLVPSAALLAGGLVGYYFGPPMGKLMSWLGEVLGQATTLQPIPMGIIMSVVMGLILTAPISSAALAAMIFTGANIGQPGVALAAGAATVGCCAQMIGFAVSSWRENGLGGFVAQGIGTSMLQVPNILRHPLILLPPTLAAAVLGPLATTIFQMKNMEGAFGGMGTCGLVGPVGTWTVMQAAETPAMLILKIALLYFILPAGLSLFFSESMRKWGWIKKGDMKLEL